VWVFGTGRPLDSEETETLLKGVDSFLDGWKAHGSPLDAARDWRGGRFLLVAVDERTAPPSGCSIDALVQRLRDLEASLSVSLVDQHPVWYREGDDVVCVDRATFRARVADGGLGPDTVVFDNTVTRLAQVQAGEWERPARESWHGRAFFR
jgi:hypothetical protein